MPDDITPELREEICDAIYARRKIEAIKLYREAKKVGLKEAKQFVDALEVRLREETPERFSEKKHAGCAGSVLLVVLAVSLVAWIIP